MSSIASQEIRHERRARLPSNERVFLGDGATDSGWTVNWSGRGLCLLLEERWLSEGDLVTVSLPERRSRADGRVVWARSVGEGCIAGVELLRLDRRVS